MEMNQRSDFILPTYNGELSTDKPPLHYFFMMGSYAVFGYNSWGCSATQRVDGHSMLYRLKLLSFSHSESQPSIDYLFHFGDLFSFPT